MIVYAESSAVLAWILAESRGDVTRRVLARADRVVCSVLTTIECRRSIERGLGAGRLTDADGLIARQILGEAARHWTVVEMAGPIPDRAARRFPHEPVRTLDAIHLATAVALQGELSDLEMLSFDDRIRTNAVALGIRLADE